MKAPTILIVILIVLTCSCSNAGSKLDIKGIYATQFKNEYTITADTLIITPTTNPAVYKVERRSGFNKVREGQTLQKEFKTATWSGTYDIDKGITSGNRIRQTNFRES